MVPLDVFGTVQAPKLPPGPLWFVAFNRHGYRRAVFARSERSALERSEALAADGWNLQDVRRGWVVTLDPMTARRAWRGHREAAVRRWVRDELAEYVRRFGALPETFTRTRPASGGDSLWLDATETRPRVKVWYRRPGSLAEAFGGLAVRAYGLPEGARLPEDPPAGAAPLPRATRLADVAAVGSAWLYDVNPEAAPPFCYAVLTALPPEDPFGAKLDAALERGRAAWKAWVAKAEAEHRARKAEAIAEHGEAEGAKLRERYGAPGEALAP